MKKLFLFIVCLCSLYVNAQVSTSHTSAAYSKEPLWIKMMADTAANFFEVETAYKIYWLHHEKPEGEHDVIGEHREREKIPSRRKQKRIQADNRMRMAVKKYERWHEKMLPYVQEDGTILTPSQRISLWKEVRSNTTR